MKYFGLVGSESLMDSSNGRLHRGLGNKISQKELGLITTQSCRDYRPDYLRMHSRVCPVSVCASSTTLVFLENEI